MWPWGSDIAGLAKFTFLCDGMNTVREAGRDPTLARLRLPCRAPASTERRPFRDNPRLILLGIVVLLAALVAMVRLADRSTELNPDFLSEVVLYALSAPT